jgi:hypothetical protein
MSAEENQSARVELYDSGATHHISPYCDDFVTYDVLNPPQYLHATNKQQFPAEGTGQMSISMPNGSASGLLTLPNILHAPAIFYTLISIRMLDAQGYQIEIEGGHMDIFSPECEHITCIPQTVHSLYQVLHDGKAMAIKVMSIMELH